MKKGSKHTEESRAKNSASHMGRYVGDKNPFFGRHHKPETIEANRMAHIGKTNSLGHKHSSETKMRISAAKHGKSVNDGVSHPMYGKHHTSEAKTQISIGNRGKTMSLEARTKISEARKQYIKENNIPWNHPNIGRNEEELLCIIEQQNGIKLDRNFWILGYHPDGYCHENNTVYEIYEKRHDKTVQEDLARETEICNKLGCDFVIFWDRSH